MASIASSTRFVYYTRTLLPLLRGRNKNFQGRLPVLAENSELSGIKEWEQGFNKEEFLKNPVLPEKGKSDRVRSFFLRHTDRGSVLLLLEAENRENEVLLHEFCSSQSEGLNGEFTLSSLMECEVRLKGCSRALFMDRLMKNVYVGVVMGFVLIEGLQKDLKYANLDGQTGNWANVDDFRWLRAVQSPNWSVLPESERGGTVDI